MVALGGGAALMSIPANEAPKRFKGPFHYSLFEEKFSSNTKDNDQRRFLQALLDCMYFAYDQEYMSRRAADPLYRPILRDTVGARPSPTRRSTRPRVDRRARHSSPS